MTKKKNTTSSLSFVSPIGYITLVYQNAQLIQLLFEKRTDLRVTDDMKKDRDQVLAYLSNRSTEITVSSEIAGTPFQEDVWRVIASIPRGYVTTYQGIANHLRKPTCARAVGQAVARNPIPIILPCHRVLGKDGKLTGYIGGIERKEFLLQLEGGSFQRQIKFPE